MPTIEKVYKPSRIRRGRLSTTPTWYVRADDGVWWRFYRKKDAVAFIAAGCACPSHDEHFLCRACHAVRAGIFDRPEPG